ncbi:uncharacterized protein I303_104420 [Kwoniella dejecticola CBS 10117]|uniref:Uncharacterized protein n=1 Tax=Kwoniella dejecticola CBS 10117 TaxID=1296121 RepID=A0A1A6A5D5_9TREE|nr:uncharacterized protein I303_04601 [Kwoniella dejecticola CBS 10117]OBR85268.1 hypothetical protein I303_04601 [Kwoniella dejecticola CBS 10117]
MIRLGPRQLLRRPINPLPSHPSARIQQQYRTNFVQSFNEFKPPPIRQRLKPLIPFFIYWSIITSLAVHLLRNRISSKEELDKQKAKISVLSDIIKRLQNGESMTEDQLQRELELVGLRERTILTQDVQFEEDVKDVGWAEVLFGKKRIKEGTDVGEKEESLDDWVQVVNEVTKPATSPIKLPTGPVTPRSPERSGETRRAPSASVYM